ncbi:MAG: DUF5667 domain-containing protein [Patescibacteria group bacterium]|nr:DUF5667 domain-containing protein [Patescibacteria group bacterium]
MNNFFLSFFAVCTLLFVVVSNVALAQTTSTLPDPGITPDNPFYFLKTWKEQIQLFFTFDAEQKARQYLHLADVRLAEYQKMIEKGKQEIADKTLQKYEDQLNRALEKAKELKDKGKDIVGFTKNIEETTVKHLQVLQENLAKVPEAAKQGLERAIEASQKGIEQIKGKIEKKIEKATPTSAIDVSDWQTYRNEQYGFEVKYPMSWQTTVPSLRIVEFYNPVPGSKPNDVISVASLSSQAITQGITQSSPNNDSLPPPFSPGLFLGKKAYFYSTNWQSSNAVNNYGIFVKKFDVVEAPFISIELRASSIAARELEDQILSTFKFISNQIESYDLYYWGGGKKILLVHPPGKVTIVTNQAFELAEITNKLKKFSQIKKIESECEICFILEHSYQDELNFIFQLRQEPYIISADEALYGSGSDSPILLLTDEITVSVWLQKEKYFLDIIKNHPISVISRTERRNKQLGYDDTVDYHLKVDYKKTRSNSLNLANDFYELSSTRWSAPNFRVRIILE